MCALSEVRGHMSERCRRAAFSLKAPGEGPSCPFQLLVPQVSLCLWPYHPISTTVITWPSLHVCVSNLPSFIYKNMSLALAR